MFTLRAIGCCSLTDITLVFSVLILRPTLAAQLARLSVIDCRDSEFHVEDQMWPDA